MSADAVVQDIPPAKTDWSWPSLMAHFRRVREQTESLVWGLHPEDLCLQIEDFASPAKWHLGHTTWFFDQMILGDLFQDFKGREEEAFLFNSYYEGLGAFQFRSHRGHRSRPSIEAVQDYRRKVTEAVLNLNGDLLSSAQKHQLQSRLRLGIEHECQHQELILMDLKVLLSYQNPTAALPCARKVSWLTNQTTRMAFQEFNEGLYELGHEIDDPGFAYDNEKPRHKQWLESFALANRLVTNGEFLEFIRDGGYQKPLLWLSDGWSWLQSQKIQTPLYWSEDHSEIYTLAGTIPIPLTAPVSHLSFYEADAYARWASCRLPTEFEWEHAASLFSPTSDDQFLESLEMEPRPASLSSPGLLQMNGDLWEWTSSDYAPYPRFRPYDGALSEYNGKFMCNQKVLRGGSCATPRSHYRRTYRNFFYPHQRWAFTGLRLAKDLP